MSNLSRRVRLPLAAATAWLLAIAVQAQNLVTTVSTGAGAGSSLVVTNPATNTIYVANLLTHTVSVINGLTNASITLALSPSASPVALAVNPVTNKIYVANNAGGSASGSVFVIDGATNAVVSIPSTGEPYALAVNSVTNKIYVATFGFGGSADNVSVIDGTSNAIVGTVTQVSRPVSLAVNPVTNKVYVANLSALAATSVTIIDGANNYAATSINVGPVDVGLDVIAVNPVTNQIYAAGSATSGGFFGEIYQIDGATATVTHQAAVGSGPYAIAVNPVTNTVYLADGNGEVYSPTPSNLQEYDVNVFNGSNLSVVAQLQIGSTTVTDVSTGTIIPYAMAVNSATNQIYVANYAGGPMTVINGADNSFATFGIQGDGSSEASVAVNPVTNRIYVANYGGNVTVIDGTVNATASLPTGDFPLNMVLNPVTNKIYVVNFLANTGVPGTVTVIDATTRAVITTVTVGIAASALDVDPVTNKIYVVNGGLTPSAGSVTVIDGNTDTATATIAVGVDPIAAVVNPDTNKVFVTNYGYGNIHGSVSVIDGATNTVSATVATRPYAIAVNTATNRVYFSNYHSVTVADGTTGATLATVATTSAGGIAVNPVSHKVYVLNNQDNNGDEDSVTVIDGATNAILAVLPTALDPAAIAINPVTNMVYVVDQGDPPYGYVTVINGATNALAPISLGGYLDGDILVPANPTSIAVNPVTNKIYVGDFGTGGLGTNTTATGTTVTVINGNNNSTVNVTTGAGPSAVLVSPVTDQVYVLNQGSSLTSGGSVSIIGDSQAVPLNVSVNLPPGNVAASATPTFIATAQSLFGPIAPPPQNVFFQIDSLTGAWTAGAPNSGTFSFTTSSLAPGLHILYAYADDGQVATATQLDSPLTGAIAVCYFVVTSAATHYSVVAPATATAGTAFSVSVVALDALNNPAIGYSGTAALTSSDSAANFQPVSSTLAGAAGTFSATLYGTPGVFNTAGETITATDTVTSSITGTTAPPGIEVFKVLATPNLVLPSSPTYDGTPKGATFTTTPSGVAFNLTYTDLSAGTPATTAAPVAAGEYEVNVTCIDPVYFFTQVVNFFGVNQATPAITWANPAAINFGTALSSTQLDATSTIAGSFVYTPPVGTVPNPGIQTLGATFTPTDATDYAVAYPSAALIVNPPPSTIPAITERPASQVFVPGGGPVIFQATTTGYPAPTYQWSFNNAPIAGATGPSLTIPNAEPGAAGLYTVTATNSQGSVTSGFAALAVITGQYSGDPTLSQPENLATDGVNLLVGGTNSNFSDPNSNAVSHKSIFRLSLPLGSEPAVSLYPAFNPNELAELSGSVFWIDPNSGPQAGTQILSASEDGGGTVNPIYTSSPVNQPILVGSGLATDGTLLYAADQANGSVWSLNPDGSGMTQIGPNRYSPGEHLNTIAVSAGTLYLADSGGTGGTPAVLNIATNGTSFTTLASGAPLVSPSGIAIGNGMVYVADPGAGNTVWQIPVGGGTPVALFAGSLGTPIGRLAGLLYFNGKLYVTDSIGGATYELQVAPQAAPAITSPLAPSGGFGMSFAYQTQVSGGVPPYFYGATGLPTGLNISPTGLITGYPQQLGLFPVTLTVTDSTTPSAQIAQVTLQLTIDPIVLTNALNANGVAGSYFGFQVNANGGSGVFTYTSTGLPSGLTMDPNSGYISGVATQVGTFNVDVTVTDTSTPANTLQAMLQITIAALGYSGYSSLTGIINEPFSFQIAPFGGTTPYVYSAQGLPAGLSLDPNAGIIAGTPTQTGSANVTLTITDSANPANSIEQQLAIAIDAFGVPSPLSATGVVGTAFSFQPPIGGGTAPYFYSTGTLPHGLTLNASTGAIIGTPAQSGFFSLQLSVSDSSVPANSAFYILNLTIGGAVGPTAATVTLTPASLSQTYTGSPLAVTATTNPTGLSLNFSYTGAGGTIYGPTPTAPTDAGTYSVGATVSTPNYQGSTSGTLTIAQAVPAITWASPLAISDGTALSATQLDATANVAGGLVYSPASGTVLAQGVQTLSVTFTPTDTTDYTTATDQVSLTVNSPAPLPVITSNPAVTGTAGSVLTLYQLTGANSPTSYQITSGTLPAGLSLNPATGAITGTPTGTSTTTVWIAATNATGQGPSLAIVFTIAPSPTTPVITSNGTASGQVGQAFTYTITATNAPISYTATGLPTGLSLDLTTGVITGVPTAPTAAPVSVTLTASTAAATSSPKTLLLSVAAAPAAPAILSAGLASGQVGAAFTYSILASNTPTSYSASNLPPGLTVNTTTGVVGGTPTQAGVYPASVQAANGGGSGAAANLVVTITAAAAAPVITSAASAAGKVGVAFSYQITAAPGTITGYAETGTLPSGLGLNSVSGLITGNPADPGQFPVELTATSAQGTSFPEPLVITINPADNVPIVTSGHAAVGTVGTAFNFTVTATNLPVTPFPAADTLDVIDLPAGLAVNPATGAISGTPVQSGAFTASVVGTNAAGTGPISPLVVTIQPAASAPVVTSSPLAPAQVGLAFSYQIMATNIPTSFQALGGPAWVTVDSQTGVVSGTPTSPGSVSLQLIASNGSGDSAPAPLTISIAPAANTPVVTSGQTVGGQVGSALSYQIAATSTPLSYLATGLPAGLTLNAATGLISGTPTDSGSFPVSVSAVNTNGQGASVTVTFTVQPSVGLGI